MRVLLLFVASLASASVHQDPSGFRVDVPAGWRVHALGEGRMVVSSPNPWMFVTVAPVCWAAASHCAAALRTTFANGWGSFPVCAQRQRPARRARHCRGRIRVSKRTEPRRGALRPRPEGVPACSTGWPRPVRHLQQKERVWCRSCALFATDRTRHRRRSAAHRRHADGAVARTQRGRLHR